MRNKTVWSVLAGNRFYSRSGKRDSELQRREISPVGEDWVKALFGKSEKAKEKLRSRELKCDTEHARRNSGLTVVVLLTDSPCMQQVSRSCHRSQESKVSPQHVLRSHQWRGLKFWMLAEWMSAEVSPKCWRGSTKFGKTEFGQNSLEPRDGWNLQLFHHLTWLPLKNFDPPDFWLFHAKFNCRQPELSIFRNVTKAERTDRKSPDHDFSFFATKIMTLGGLTFNIVRKTSKQYQKHCH